MSTLPKLMNYIRANRAALLPKVTPPHLDPSLHSANNVALVGDRLLDLRLYIQLDLLTRTEDFKGRATQLRSSIVKNRNLARVADGVGVELFGAEKWALLSEKDRGTVLEALMGAAFELEGCTLNEPMTELLDETLDAAIDTAKDAAELGQSCIGRLMEILAKPPYQVERPGDWLTEDRLSEFVFRGKVLLPDPSSDPLVFYGRPAPNKAETREDAALKALQYLGRVDESVSLEVSATAGQRTISVDELESGCFVTFELDGAISSRRRPMESWREWFERKTQASRAWYGLFLTWAHIPEHFKVEGWTGRLGDEHVAILRVALQGSKATVVGMSETSKNKAKTNAASRAVEALREQLIQLLEEFAFEGP